MDQIRNTNLNIKAVLCGNTCKSVIAGEQLLAQRALHACADQDQEGNDYFEHHQVIGNFSPFDFKLDRVQLSLQVSK